MSTLQKTSWRVLVGASCFADARSALRLIERLSGPELKELGGILLEDAILSGIAELPKQRIVSPGGALTHAPSRKKLDLLTESDATAFRTMLSNVAQPRNWGFERRRGDLISGLYEAAKGWDLLCVGFRELHRFAGQVVVISPPAEASQRAVEMASELANSLETSLRKLSIASPGATPTLSHTGEESFETGEALLSRLSRIPASALVVDLAAGPLTEVDDLRELVAAARCPVIVLGAGGAPRLAQKRGEKTRNEIT